MNIYKEIVNVLDATFEKTNLDLHYREHTDPSTGKTQLPKGMTKEQYAKKAEEVSLKNIDPITRSNRSVRAFKKKGANVICKSDGSWFVTYNNKFGRLNTAYPQSMSYYEDQLRKLGEYEFMFSEDERRDNKNNSKKKRR